MAHFDCILAHTDMAHSLYAAHGRFTAASPNAFDSAQGLAAGPTKSVRERPPFHARACSGAPHFHFAAAHTYQSVGELPPPPPPGPQPI